MHYGEGYYIYCIQDVVMDTFDQYSGLFSLEVYCINSVRLAYTCSSMNEARRLERALIRLHAGKKMIR